MDLASFLFLLLTTAAAADTNDTAVLTLFRTQTDLHGSLSSNWTTATNTSTACTANWKGVNCTDNRVTAVILPFLNLRGPIDALSSLDHLHFLDLRGNRFNGSLAPLAQCLNLKLVYLSDNDFFGDIPPELSSLHRLLRLDLSNNNLHGSIPTQFSKLTRLLTLRLQNNDLSGTIPNFLDSLPQLKELNLSNNEISGILQQSLFSKFGASSFSGNQGLCGNGPLPNCSDTYKHPPSQTVPSNPSSFPSLSTKHHHHSHRLSYGAVVAIVVANSVLLLLFASFAICYYCSSTSRDTNSESEGGKRSSYSSEKRVYASNGSGGDNSDGTNATDKSRLVFFDRKTKQFELEELLRASAEMLGRGSLGTVYKAVLDDGSTVAVKRLKDANPCERKEFDKYMNVIGMLRHPNVVKFRGYYYAREEKLLVYDYLPNGSLHSFLHGSRGPGRIPLDWTTRISLILGAARGLARIHENNNGGSRIPHGNVKSSNVLLDKNGIACISDFGLSLLLSPAHAITRLGGYRAPEQAETKTLSQKADVYSFGVVLLELLTGRDSSLDLPKWVRSVVRDEWTAEVFDPELLRYKNIEEELVSMLHVAMMCVVMQPEKRPGMDQVVMMVEEIRVEQSPLGEDCIESRNSLSPSLGNTDDGLG